MLASFLTRGLDAAPLFEGLEVSCDPAAMAHLGAHDVIYIDFSVLPDECESCRDYIDAIRAGIVDDLRAFAPEAGVEPRIGLFAAHECVYDVTKAQFCLIMDEWDSLFFNPLFTEDGQRSFLMLLKQLLKTKPYVELSHMAGILSIAKHSTGSELNMFVEYGAVEDLRYDRFFGFTQDEVCELCARHLACTPDARVGYEGLEHWYDGYLTEDGERRFNPRSVVPGRSSTTACAAAGPSRAPTTRSTATCATTSPPCATTWCAWQPASRSARRWRTTRPRP